MNKASLMNGISGIRSTLLGWAIIIGILLLGGSLFLGAAKISAFLYPVFSVLAGLSISAFVALVLPLSLINKFSPFLAPTSMILSMICGATIWMFSFLVIVGYLGWIAIFLLFMFESVAPIAVMILFFKQHWYAGFSIVVGLLITYGMKFYSLWLVWLAEKHENKIFSQQEGQVIDVEPTITE